MTKMLDLLEDYCELKGYVWDRIDGMTHWSERQPKMDEFNRPDSDGFIFLLSTRAGGLGVNLVGADTVIIYDSDFNPQQDLQAMDRAHRIGQKRPVTILRMVTINSVETKIVERANNKRKLELVAIARKRFKVSDKIEHGADIAMLEQAGNTDVDERRSMVKTLTEVSLVS
jgi:SNF2 family DNA or RNA helicase